MQTGTVVAHTHTHTRIIIILLSPFHVHGRARRTLQTNISHPEIGGGGGDGITEMSRCFKEEICIGVRQQLWKYDLDFLFLPIFLALAFEKKC